MTNQTNFRVCQYLYLNFICIGARVDSTIYMEVLLVIYFVRINGDRLQRGPGVTVSFKPTQRRSTPVTQTKKKQKTPQLQVLTVC